MSDFHGVPGGKNVSRKTEPAVISYGDTLRVTSGSYEFGFGATAESHCLAIWPMSQPVGPDPLVSALEMPEITTGVYQLDSTLLTSGAFFNAVEGGGTLGAAPALTIFKEDAGEPLLRIESTLFSTEDVWYLVGVCTLATPGDIATVENLVDFQVVYLQGTQLDVISSAALVGIDSTTLDIALAAAGHNVRLHSVTFIDGRPATRVITGADNSLEAVGTPELEDPDSTVGAGTTFNQLITMTPDSNRLPSTDISEDA